MTNRQRHIILSGILCFAATFTCAPAINAGDRRLISIPHDEFIVEGISIGSAYGEITAKLGKPSKVEKGAIARGQCLLVYYEGMQIVIFDDKAVNITITSAGYKMKNGIAVGSSEQEVFDKLGKPEGAMRRGMNTVRYAVKTPRGDYSDDQLIILFKDDKVFQLVFFSDYI